MPSQDASRSSDKENAVISSSGETLSEKAVAFASVIVPEYALPKLRTGKCSLPPLWGTMKSAGAEVISELGP